MTRLIPLITVLLFSGACKGRVNSDLSDARDRNKGVPFQPELYCHEEFRLVPYIRLHGKGSAYYDFEVGEEGFRLRCVTVEDGAECTQSKEELKFEKVRTDRPGRPDKGLIVYIRLKSGKFTAEAKELEEGKLKSKAKMNCEKVENDQKQINAPDRPDSGGTSYYPQGRS